MKRVVNKVKRGAGGKGGGGGGGEEGKKVGCGAVWRRV